MLIAWNSSAMEPHQNVNKIPDEINTSGKVQSYTELWICRHGQTLSWETVSFSNLIRSLSEAWSDLEPPDHQLSEGLCVETHIYHSFSLEGVMWFWRVWPPSPWVNCIDHKSKSKMIWIWYIFVYILLLLKWAHCNWLRSWDRIMFYFVYSKSALDYFTDSIR